MPIDAAVLDQLEANAQYVGEGVATAARFLRSFAPFFEFQTDSLTRLVTSPLSNTATAVETAAASLYFVRITSPTAATQDACLQIYNVAAAGVTVGTTAPADMFVCPMGKTRTIVVCPAHDSQDLYSTAISYAATTVPATGLSATALGSASQPTVEVISA